MAQILNSEDLIFESSALNGPVLLLATQASKFKCGIVKIYVSETGLEGSYSYINFLSSNQNYYIVNHSGVIYIKFELKTCQNSIVYVDVIESGPSTTPNPSELNILLLEDGDFVLLENNDFTLLEV